MRRVFASFTVAAAFFASALNAQDPNMLHPIGVIEQRLRSDPLEVLDYRGSRTAQDRTQTVVLGYPDGSTMRIKWAKAAPGGAAFNNEPRYEIAAYEIQKLFLDEADYIVPPTVARAVPLAWLRRWDANASATFSGTNSVVLVMQYWLLQVSGDSIWNEKRFDADTVYARHIADFNILTYLIRHNDSNAGNFLISTSSNGRVFAVDNGVSFRSEVSNRGYYWRDLRVERLPRATVERLRQITREDLDRTLGIVAHFDKREEELVAAEPSANLGAGRGVRNNREAAQFGLTSGEIGDVFSRLQRLLQRVDEGKITVF